MGTSFIKEVARMDKDKMLSLLFWLGESSSLHNVLFGQYVFLPTEQAETYLKIYVMIYHSTYICPSLFGWKENLIFKELNSKFGISGSF